MAGDSDVLFILRAEGCIHSSDVRHVSSSEWFILTASRDQSAMIHPVVPATDNIEPGLVLLGHKAFVNFVLLHPSIALLGGEACVVTGGNDNHVALWNPVTAALEAVLDGHGQGVCCGIVVASAASHSEDGDIVTGDWAGVCLVFDATTGRIKQRYAEHKTAVRGIAQLPGTNSVVTASGDKTVHQWDLVTGSTIAVFSGHSDAVQCICALSARRFASGGNDATIMFWDTEAGTAPLRVLKAHESLVFSLSYCPARRLLFSASEDRTVKVWRGGVLRVNASDVGGGEDKEDVVAVQSIAHPCVVWSVCVTGAGDIATGGADGVLRVWTADDSKMASVEKLQALETAVAAQVIDMKVVAIAGLNRESLPSVDELHLHRGAVEGGRLLARTGSGLIEMYHWNRGRWDKVGTVVEGPPNDAHSGTQQQQQRGKVYLNGTPHDYVFDVDVNGTMLKLAYDRGQNVLDAAQRFINENGHVVSQSHREEIQNFILNNIDPSDAQLLTGSGARTLAVAPPSASDHGEPIFSEFARESAAMRQGGVSHVPSLGEALRNMGNTTAPTDTIAFSQYAREGLELQQQAAQKDLAASPAPNAVESSIAPWDSYKLNTVFNAAGAQRKINELTGDDAHFGNVVQRVQAAAFSDVADKGLLEDIIVLYHRLPESSRFPAIDLLGYLLAAATRPLDWLLLLLLLHEDDATKGDKDETSGGGGGHSTPHTFMEERVSKLCHVSETEALVTIRLCAHAVAALDTMQPGVTLSASQVAMFLAALTKAPQSLLRTTNSGVKTVISALMRNAAVLLSRKPSVFGEEAAAHDATQGVVRLLSQWLVFESVSSPHTRELLATVLTLVLSGSTAAVAVALGRSTLAHTMRALKACPDPCCREAATTIMRVLDGPDAC